MKGFPEPLTSQVEREAAAWPASGKGLQSTLSPASARAYKSDIRDIDQWCKGRGLNAGIVGLDERTLFAYLVELVHLGRSPATVRRRLTALRSFVDYMETVPPAAGQPRLPMLKAEQLFTLEKRVPAELKTQTGVLIVSDDSIVRAGLASVLSESGVLCWSEKVKTVDAATFSVWDYVLVWVATSRGIDSFGAVEAIRALDSDLTAQVPIVAVHPGKVSPVVRLRLVEAGMRYAVPQSWLSSNFGSLSALLANAEIPQRYHLETPLALRQKLDLSLSGDLGALLDAAAQMPSIVWTGHLSQDRLPISRKEILKVRLLALEKAGVPAPAFSKYATSLRAAPTLPEWSEVRKIVRLAFAIDT